MLIYCRVADGELEELIEEFNDGKVQFAFVKVKDPNSGLPKFVLICWVRYLFHVLCYKCSRFN